MFGSSRVHFSFVTASNMLVNFNNNWKTSGRRNPQCQQKKSSKSLLFCSTTVGELPITVFLCEGNRLIDWYNYQSFAFFLDGYFLVPSKATLFIVGGSRNLTLES